MQPIILIFQCKFFKIWNQVLIQELRQHDDLNIYKVNLDISCIYSYTKVTCKASKQIQITHMQQNSSKVSTKSINTHHQHIKNLK